MMEDEHKSEFYFSPENSKRSSVSLGFILPPSPQRQQQYPQSYPHYSQPNTPLHDDDYGHWDDTMESGSVHSFPDLVDSLPPQLHPAVSLGMKRVSSCAYYSLQGSQADLHSLSSEYASEVQQMAALEFDSAGDDTTADLLSHHDILVQVLTFLDAPSLVAFSETARRCNFECFYFLQLQLQRALLVEGNLHRTGLLSSLHPHPSNSNSNNAQQQQQIQPTQQNQDDQLAAIAGSWSISRLASLDKKEAESVVQEYLDSNSTLRILPLAHSLAYIRQVLRRNGFAAGQGESQGFTTSAAVVIGLVGVSATIMTGNVNADVVESFAELPNMIFKVGFVGSLVGAARHQWENNTEGETAAHGGAQAHTMRETAGQMARTMHSTMREMAEQMARTMQQVRMTSDSADAIEAGIPGATKISTRDGDSSIAQQQRQAQEASISWRMYEAFLAASGRPSSPEESAGDTGSSQQDTNNRNRKQQQDLLGPNPYEHLPIDTHPKPRGGEAETAANRPNKPPNGETTIDGTRSAPSLTANIDEVADTTITPRKMSSGCVGAYFRAIHRASNSITKLVQQQRRSRFDALPDNELLAQSFIDACCSDESLDMVKDMVQGRGIIDAQGFFVGSDGSETTALHASSFHGATTVLEFLCGGIDERDARNDQGLCSVDVQDVNGWTALHFAAGANCVESVRILADRGASLSITAENGYTPIQWAIRLQNQEVAEELQRRLEQHDPYLSSNRRWMAGASQPLSMIAHHFFALIPTQ